MFACFCKGKLENLDRKATQKEIMKVSKLESTQTWFELQRSVLFFNRQGLQIETMSANKGKRILI
jgi:hypothetical protein